MKRKKLPWALLLLGVVLLVSSCKKEEYLTAITDENSLTLNCVKPD